MKAPDSFPMTMQNSLRFSCIWMIVWPFLSFGLAYVSHAWTLVVAAPFTSAMIYLSLKSAHGDDYKKWWWLWKGPLITMREDVKTTEAIVWLNECMPERWKNVYPYVIKFKNKADATAFKLVFG